MNRTDLPSDHAPPLLAVLKKQPKAIDEKPRTSGCTPALVDNGSHLIPSIGNKKTKIQVRDVSRAFKKRRPTMEEVEEEAVFINQSINQSIQSLPMGINVLDPTRHDGFAGGWIGMNVPTNRSQTNFVLDC
jgi:hypothetical protein